MCRISILLLLLSVPLSAAAPKVVDWASDEGVHRLERSRAKVDFFSLASHFESQTNKISCGPTTAVIVLNSYRQGKDVAPEDPQSFDESSQKYLPEKYNPRLHRYTPLSFFSEEASKIKTKKQFEGDPIEGKADVGLQLRQLYQMLEAHGLKVKLRVADEKLKDADIKMELIHNLKTKGDYAVVNFARKELDQSGGGHISPLGAYDAQTDSFLVLDVNPTASNWFWVSATHLIKAMRTKDTVENRGYLLIAEGPAKAPEKK